MTKSEIDSRRSVMRLLHYRAKRRFDLTPELPVDAVRDANREDSGVGGVSDWSYLLSADMDEPVKLPLSQAMSSLLHRSSRVGVFWSWKRSAGDGESL
jgi:hypothetical protein